MSHQVMVKNSIPTVKSRRKGSLMRLSSKARNILSGVLLAVTAAASVTAFVPSAAATTSTVTPGCDNPKYSVGYGDQGLPSDSANPGLVKINYSASPAGTTKNVTITPAMGVVLCKTLFYDTDSSGGPYHITASSTNSTSASHTSATGSQAVEVSATDAVATTPTVPVSSTKTAPPVCNQTATSSYDGTQVTISGVLCNAGNASTYTILNTKCDGIFDSGSCVPQAIFRNVPVPAGDYGKGTQFYLSAPDCGYYQFDLYKGEVQAAVTQAGTSGYINGFIAKTRDCPTQTTTPPTTTMPPVSTTTAPPVKTTTVPPVTTTTSVVPPTTTLSVIPPTVVTRSTTPTTTTNVVAPPVTTLSTPPAVISHINGGGIPTGVDAGQASNGSNRMAISLMIAAITLMSMIMLNRRNLSDLLASQRGRH
jgi:hypothetical protein